MERNPLCKHLPSLLYKVLLLCCLLLPLSLRAAEPLLALNPQALPIIYSGQEKMHFAVSWSGGIKIGDLHLSLATVPSGGQAITARVTDYGLFKAIYPVDDTFVTYLRGPLKLPQRYEVQQIERSKTVRRLTLYDQKKFKAVYRRQDNLPETYQLNGPAYNEFSAFFITRALHLNPEQRQNVPVFVDKKRHLVPVNIFGKEIKTTLFGTMSTVKVQPKMAFRGLYNKDGETVFWLTDDACRVPVEIRSKILIGSLVAELVDYTNPVCPLRKQKQAEK
jgi:hypothetical protein